MPSYGTDEGLIAYLAETGRALPADSVAAQFRAAGTAYVDSFEDMFASTSVSATNSFPRVAWPDVPVRIEYATYEAAWAVSQGVDLFGAGGTAGGQVVREKVDVLEVQYADPGQGSYWENNRFILPRAYAYLVPFFGKGGHAGAFVV